MNMVIYRVFAITEHAKKIVLAEEFLSAEAALDYYHELRSSKILSSYNEDNIYIVKVTGQEFIDVTELERDANYAD